MLKIQTEVLASGLELYFVPSRFLSNLDPNNSQEDFKTLGIACRLNTLSMIKAAGSGHIGSSFSAIDLIIASSIIEFLYKSVEKFGEFCTIKNYSNIF